MSLRARLIAGLLAVSTVGLVLLGGVTYVEQRSFLLDRIDRQADAALGAVDRRLDGGGPRGPELFGPGRGAPGRRRPPGGGGPDDLVNLPPGTYGQHRDAQGRPTASVTLFLNGQTAPSPPRLPTALTAGRTLDVDARRGDLRYRVFARANARGGPGALTVVAIPLGEVDRTLHRLLIVEALVVAGVLAVMALAGVALVRLGLRPLDRIGQTADAIAGGDLSRRVEPATQRTEVGRLGLALNAMLARVEDAFGRQRASEERLRTFLADASHELRTPLSSIRGYAELFRLGAASDPEDLSRAMTRIEQEAARMGVLVEDLLTLARLDELPGLQAEPVDLASMAQDAVLDARAAAQERQITLTADPQAFVHGDPHQLRQVFANLLRNATVHTPDGTPIAVTVTVDDTATVLTVRDRGPGLPHGETEALFDRFWRADSGRGPGRDGAGLGLAIVAEIVAAHGGRAGAADAVDGPGAVFTVRLPRHPRRSP